MAPKFKVGDTLTSRQGELTVKLVSCENYGYYKGVLHKPYNGYELGTVWFSSWTEYDITTSGFSKVSSVSKKDPRPSWF